MYTLFNSPGNIEKGVRQPSTYNYLHERLNDNLEKVILHLQESNYAVRSNHLLVKLLLGLNLDPKLSLFEYYSKAQSRADDITKANGLSSTLTRRDVFEDGVFYGKDTTEAIVSISEDFDILKLDTDWRTLETVKVLRHPFTSLALDPLDGRNAGTDGDFAIIQVDVIKLAMQYRQWVLEQYAISPESIRTPMQFVFQYPIANAMRSHLDLAIMNRLIALYRGREVTKFKSTWSFYLQDLDKITDEYLFNRISYFQRRPMEYEDILKQVGLPSSSNLLDLVILPKTVVTRQIEWIMVLVRTPIIGFLVELDFDIGGHRNRQSMSIIRKSLKALESDRSFSSTLPSGMRDEIVDKAVTGISLYL